MKLRKDTVELLNDIEKRINPEVEDDYINQWRVFWNGKSKADIFTPKRKVLSPPDKEREHVNINDAVKDTELMFYKEMMGVSDALNSNGGCLSIRANYGTGIISSLFGAKIFTMPYKNDTLPTTHPYNNIDKINEILDKGMPQLTEGFGKNVFEAGEFFKEAIKDYPKISKYLIVANPDAQGPLDLCELLWGSDMFYALYDEPETVNALLRLITDTYKVFMKKWFELFPSGEFHSEWGSLLYKGNILLRDDSAMNLSPDFYKEFAFPYDNELLNEFDGGVVHFCGTGDHYISELSKAKKLYAINMSQPHLNNMEKIYQNTVDKGIKILAFNHDYAYKDVVRKNKFNHCLHTSK